MGGSRAPFRAAAAPAYGGQIGKYKECSQRVLLLKTNFGI